MPDVLCLYIDDSGTRNPDRKPGLPAPERDWFGLGGVLVRESDKDKVAAHLGALRKKWKITVPLHLSDIKARVDGFRWLRKHTDDEVAEFNAELTALTTLPELTAIACVIDRPGYNHRYVGQYGLARWRLCRTAFSIVVERAVKFARQDGSKLRVFAERSDPKTDRIIRKYYEQLCTEGSPFNAANSAEYGPVTAGEYRETLYEFRTKDKTSPTMQIADLCLWPMCIGGYDPEHPAYMALKSAGTLIDSRVSAAQASSLGIKYSCFELVNAPKKQTPDSEEPGAAAATVG